MAVCKDCNLIFNRNGSKASKLCDLCWEIARKTNKRPLLIAKREKLLKNIVKNISKYRK